MSFVRAFKASNLTQLKLRRGREDGKRTVAFRPLSGHESVGFELSFPTCQRGSEQGARPSARCDGFDGCAFAGISCLDRIERGALAVHMDHKDLDGHTWVITVLMALTMPSL